MAAGRAKRAFRGLVHGVLVAVGSSGLTFAFFLVLPVIQAISRPPSTDLVVRAADTANVPPPPPPPEEETEEEPEPEEEPPELEEPQSEPIDLSQLEMALEPGLGEGVLAGDFALDLGGAEAAGDVDSIFTMADLDQRPRVIYQPGPVLDAQVRKEAPGTVYVIFAVDRGGRVESAKVQRSSDPVFEKPALAAVKQWRFEPGRRNGEAVRFRMRVPITFPEP